MKWIIPLAIAFTYFLTGCDQCADVNCLNGGTCDDGTCICPEGFTGSNCETAESTPCDTIVCYNGGVCIDGSCFCPPGYTGANCEIEIQADPCDTINCLNGATCISGVCDCTDGYEGTFCEVESRAKFIDGFAVEEECNPGTYVYNVNITEGSSITRVDISNFGSYGVVVYGEVDGTSITIPQQSNQIGGFSGNGSIDGDILTISYTVNLGISSFNCVMTCTRQ